MTYRTGENPRKHVVLEFKVCLKFKGKSLRKKRREERVCCFEQTKDTVWMSMGRYYLRKLFIYLTICNLPHFLSLSKAEMRRENKSGVNSALQMPSHLGLTASTA